jgi:hypothetical protein
MILDRPTLIFRATCPRCRIAATAIRVLSLGGLRLGPLDRTSADALAERMRAKLILRYRDDLRMGVRAAVTGLCHAAPRWIFLASLLLVLGIFQ